MAAGSGSFEYEMPVDRLVVLSRLDESDGYLSGGLKLFDISSVDLTKVLNENVIICTLFYKINDVDGAISFELQQKSSNEIDWGT